MAALRSGKVDFKQHVKSLDQVESLGQTNPEIVVHEWWFRSSDSFAPNHRVPPFDGHQRAQGDADGAGQREHCGYVLEGSCKCDTSRADKG